MYNHPVPSGHPSLKKGGELLIIPNHHELQTPKHYSLLTTIINEKTRNVNCGFRSGASTPIAIGGTRDTILITKKPEIFISGF